MRRWVRQTFVDPDYAQGTAYKATNWTPLGMSAGSGRHARDFYQKHDKPKTLWAIELCKNARLRLADSEALPETSLAGVNPDAVRGCAANSATCKSLHDLFATLPEPRKRSGMRYPQAQLLSIMTLGMLCGCPDLQAIVLLGQKLTQPQLRALGGWRRKKTGLYLAPSYSAFYNLLGQIDTSAFDAALCQWLNAHEGDLPRDLALDGKVLRGTKDMDGKRLALVALIEKNTQRLVAQQPMRVIKDNDKSKQEGELTAARRLLKEVPSLEGATVTGDAMLLRAAPRRSPLRCAPGQPCGLAVSPARLTRKDIVKSIVQEKGGEYLLAIKDNNSTLYKQIQRAFEGNQPGAVVPFFSKAPKSERTAGTSNAAYGR